MAEEKSEGKVTSRETAGVIDKEAKKKKPEWIKMKPAELEKIVVDLYNQGETPAKIGLVLRDKYGIPKAKLLGKRVVEILKDAKTPLRSEKDAISKKIENLQRHMEKNKHDQPAKKKLVAHLRAIKSA
jgi:small subunit ribosomal protein S15